MSFSVFEYMYRDGGNWKTFCAVRLRGAAKRSKARLLGCVESNNLFVAEQVGIPSLCEQHWARYEDGSSEIDHAFHEFLDIRLATPADADIPLLSISLLEMLKRFEAAAFRWNVLLSPNSHL